MCLTLLSLPCYILPVHAATATHLVISEVQIAGTATTDDFVELYNPTSSAVSLNQFRLVKRTAGGSSDTTLKSFGTSDVIPAYGYFLWANSSFTGITVVPDATTAGTLAADNGVALRDGAADTGVIVDSVAWGLATNVFVEGNAFGSNPPASQSIERKPGIADATHGNGEDTDSNVSDFDLRVVPEPQNTTTASELPPGALAPVTPVPVTYNTNIFINEIMPAPGTVTDWDGDLAADTNDEWVELYNADTGTVDISGWTLDDIESGGSTAYTIPTTTTIGAGGYLVLYKKDTGLILNNTGDSVVLKNPNGVVQDQLDYSATTTDVSISRNLDGTGQWVVDFPVSHGLKNTAPVPVVVESAGGGGGSTTTTSTNATTTNSSSSSSSVVTQTSPASTPQFSNSIRVSSLLPNPKGADGTDEYIEVENTGSDTNLKNWSLVDSGGKIYEIKADRIIHAGERITFFSEDTKISLNNAGDSITLFDPAKHSAASVTYTNALEGARYVLQDGAWKWEHTSVLVAETSKPITKATSAANVVTAPSVPKTSVPVVVPKGSTPTILPQKSSVVVEEARISSYVPVIMGEARGELAYDDEALGSATYVVDKRTAAQSSTPHFEKPIPQEPQKPVATQPLVLMSVSLVLLGVVAQKVFGLPLTTKVMSLIPKPAVPASSLNPTTKETIEKLFLKK